MPSKISIIVPAFNVESYIGRCIESIIHQSYTDLEIIIINDGSSDLTSEVCRKYAELDNRIIYTEQPNSGVSSARNHGIKLSSGDWIAFIDSDDWIDKEYLEFLLKNVSSYNDVDLITSGIKYCFQDGSQEIECPQNTGCFYMNNCDGMYSISTQTLITSPVGKLYKKSIICDNSLEFDKTICFGEDRDFNIRYLSFCKSCKITDYVGYNYRKDLNNSLSTVRRGNIIDIDLEYWTRLKNLFNDRGFLTDDVRKYLINRLYNFIIDYITCNKISWTEASSIQNNLDKTFIRENYMFLNVNFIMKMIFRMGYITIIYLIISCRKFICR